LPRKKRNTVRPGGSRAARPARTFIYHFQENEKVVVRDAQLTAAGTDGVTLKKAGEESIFPL
jgi:hypothetical protein